MNERTAIAFQHREQTFSRAPVERDNIILGSCRAIEMAESNVRAVPCNEDILLERSAFFSGDQLCIFFSLVTRLGCLCVCPSANDLGGSYSMTTAPCATSANFVGLPFVLRARSSWNGV